MPKIFKILFISVLVGTFSGVLSSSFLHLLSLMTVTRESYPLLIWGLPFFGLLFGLIMKNIPHYINEGIPYVLTEMENKEAKLSAWKVPYIFLSSLGTHLFGGSAGREGVGVIMGVGIGQILPKFHNAFGEMRTHLVYAGIAAGFASIFGTPLTGFIFAFELHSFRHIRRLDLIMCTLLASFSALVIPHFFGPSHQHLMVNYEFSLDIFYYVLLAGMSAGLGAILFYWGLRIYMKNSTSLIPRIEMRLFLGGLLVSLLVFFTNSYEYIGIGTDIIEKSFSQPRSFYDFLMKCLLTIMTLAVGFKGGEVTPLFFMGATLSNSMASFFKLTNYGLSSALGMISLFGVLTNTIFASSVMAMELFGWDIGLLSLVSCYIGKKFLGDKTVYRPLV